MVCTTSELIYYQSFTNVVHLMCTSSALCVTLSSVSTVGAWFQVWIGSSNVTNILALSWDPAGLFSPWREMRRRQNNDSRKKNKEKAISHMKVRLSKMTRSIHCMIKVSWAAQPHSLSATLCGSIIPYISDQEGCFFPLNEPWQTETCYDISKK